jgi:hypothetical protein
MELVAKKTIISLLDESGEPMRSFTPTHHYNEGAAYEIVRIMTQPQDRVLRAEERGGAILYLPFSRYSIKEIEHWERVEEVEDDVLKSRLYLYDEITLDVSAVVLAQIARKIGNSSYRSVEEEVEIDEIVGWVSYRDTEKEVLLYHKSGLM